MINSTLFLFIILLLSLVLCSFLGGHNCLKEGFTSNSISGANGSSITTATGVSGNSGAIMVGPGGIYTASDISGNTNSNALNNINQSTFYGPNGGSAQVTSSSGVYLITVTDASGNVTTYTYNSNNSAATNATNAANTTIQSLTFYGPYGGQAQVISGSNGNYIVRISYPSGEYIDYTTTNPNVNNYNSQSVDSSINQGGLYPASSTSAYYYPNTNTNTNANTNTSAGYATGPNGNSAGYATGPYGNTIAGTSTNNNSYNNSYPNTNANTNTSAGYATGPNGNSIGYATGPYGNTVVGTSTNSSSYSNNGYNYSNSLPPGIPQQMIPQGQEDLYILKSEVVPPVCPACPSSTVCGKAKKCNPCPAPQRCPDPSMTCKAVPNYDTINNQYLPVPVVNSFSTFGM